MNDWEISRVMSTQHPDNVKPPFFSDTNIIGGEEEIKEAFYAFSHLQCKEQLWDCEGKEVDNHVVKKLLTRYEPFFQRNKLGKNRFLTLRVPNPAVEKEEAKILLETFMSISRSYDVAKLFYNEDIPPIFEVALPMVTDSKSLIRIAEYYKQFIIGAQDKPVMEGDVKLSEWIGEFNPKKINIIPLFETKDAMINCDQMVKEYVSHQKIEGHQRVWLARSDPALNYGSLAAVMINKIALMKLHELQEDISLEIMPILGCGTAPFRGNFRPDNVDNMLKGYPSVHTYTIQSAFKYDYPEETVVDAVKKLNETKKSKPIYVDVEKSLAIIEKLTDEYQKSIKLLVPEVNAMAPHVPNRRKRKLHIGLFGYSRSAGDVKLPRAIKFCSAMYSWGLPPELLALNVLGEKEIDYIKDVYQGFDEDLRMSLNMLNKDNLKYFPKEISDRITKVSKLINYEEDHKHKKITSIIADNLKDNDFELLRENIERAGLIRGFLG